MENGKMESTEYIDSDGSIKDFDKYGQSLFGDELEINPFLKPQTGIIQISSETEGALGAIKKTNVVFVVHNFRDFDNLGLSKNQKYMYENIHV